ncbi:hypothetical protein AB0C07_21410 [Actinoplanes missouriensis]|uniref:hypothetical protein n=1 Tax=Actinoplanes missouriensis TaxID=1866 RepID=UPI0033E2656F
MSIDTQVEAAGPRRERDITGWLITPVATLVLAPPLTMILGVVLLNGDSAPAICHDVAAANGCEELTLGLIGEHAVVFGLLWLALWALPWWLSLRRVRTIVAVVAAVVLLAIPIRMAAADDGSDTAPGTTYTTR